MSSISVAGDSSGAISIAAPLVAGSGVLTLPTGTDTLVGKATTDTLTNKTLTSPTITGATITVAATAAPAFSAYKSTNQSISSNVFTKVQFQTEEFDTNSNYDNVTNYRFTPTVAGYYQINSLVYMQAASSLVRVLCNLYKNGAIAKFGNDNIAVSGTEGRGLLSTIVYLNGSTDYLEMYILTAGTTLTATAGADNTYFQAAMIRSA